MDQAERNAGVQIEEVFVNLSAGGLRSHVESVEIDTAFYKGNYPDSCSLLAADLPGSGNALLAAVVTASMFWDELLPQQKLQSDSIHSFDAVKPLGPVTHVRLNIFPDGGISRLRLFGKLAE